MSTSDILESLIEKDNGYLITSKAIESGVSKPSVSKYVREHDMEKVAHGIYILDDDAPVGEEPLKYMGIDDTIYHLDLNPNRNIDCTNHIGFAYEVASVLGKKVTMPDISTKPISDRVDNYISLTYS